MKKISESIHSVPTGNDVKVFNGKGDEIDGVISIDVNMSVNSIITATMDVHVGSIERMDDIHALLGTETLDQIAELHGYKMVALDE